MRQLKNLEIANKRVLLRLDLNLPFKNGKLIDDTKIIRSLPTIKYLIDKKAKIIIISHFGRPKGKFEQKNSLLPIVNLLENYYNHPVKFSTRHINEVLDDISNLNAGEIIVLENLRFYSGEEECDTIFIEKLASFGDLYINEAFSCSHRKHSSIVGLPKLLPSFAGFGLLEELQNIEIILKKSLNSSTLIIGGAKVSTKILLLNNLIKKIDNLIITGGMANTFLAACGHKIGKSFNEHNYLEEAKNILETAKSLGKNIFLPIDFVVATSSNEKEHTNCKLVYYDQIGDNDIIFDIGSESVKKICNLIEESKILIWNGPVGVFENQLFNCGTAHLTRLIWQRTKYHDLCSIISGGDTVAAIRSTSLIDEGFSYISTGGGAFLEYLKSEELPGIIALRDCVI